MEQKEWKVWWGKRKQRKENILWKMQRQQSMYYVLCAKWERLDRLNMKSISCKTSQLAVCDYCAESMNWAYVKLKCWACQFLLHSLLTILSHYLASEQPTRRIYLNLRCDIYHKYTIHVPKAIRVVFISICQKLNDTNFDACNLNRKHWRKCCDRI